METAVLELISMIKELSPQVWSITMRQVYLEIFYKFIWGGVFSIPLLMTFNDKFKKWLEDDEDDFLKFLKHALLVLSGIIALAFISNGIAWLLNPEFYAIRWLISKLN